MMRSLGELIFNFADRQDADLGFKLARLWRNWREIMGQVGLYVRPLGHRNRTLLLGVDDPLAMQESLYEAQGILELANSFLGELYFDKAHFDLLQGKAPLDEAQARAQNFWPPREPRIEALGGLNLGDDTALGRCYQAYARRFAAKG